MKKNTRRCIFRSYFAFHLELLSIYRKMSYNPCMGKPVVREVKILDAVLKEEEGSEDEPNASQYIWLQLQDVKNQVILTSTLSLDDIKELTGMDRYLQGRELINFTIALKSREAPVSLVFNPDDHEITADMIKNEEGI